MTGRMRRWSGVGDACGLRLLPVDLAHRGLKWA
jgi:hypothetical protein